eukprot:scaffold1178_cov252-Pinguiococcus_pyrenoidosus.AAC.41
MVNALVVSSPLGRPIGLDSKSILLRADAAQARCDYHGPPTVHVASFLLCCRVFQRLSHGSSLLIPHGRAAARREDDLALGYGEALPLLLLQRLGDHIHDGGAPDRARPGIPESHGPVVAQRRDELLPGLLPVVRSKTSRVGLQVAHRQAIHARVLLAQSVPRSVLIRQFVDGQQLTVEHDELLRAIAIQIRHEGRQLCYRLPEVLRTEDTWKRGVQSRLVRRGDLKSAPTQARVQNPGQRRGQSKRGIPRRQERRERQHRHADISRAPRNLRHRRNLQGRTLSGYTAAADSAIWPGLRTRKGAKKQWTTGCQLIHGKVTDRQKAAQKDERRERCTENAPLRAGSASVKNALEDQICDVMWAQGPQRISLRI